MAASTLFVYGMLCRTSLRRKILGRVCRTRPALLSGYARINGKWPYIVKRAGASVKGLILTSLTQHDWKVLDDYEDVGLGLYVRRRLRIGQATPYIYLPVLKNWPSSWR